MMQNNGSTAESTFQSFSKVLQEWQYLNKVGSQALEELAQYIQIRQQKEQAAKYSQLCDLILEMAPSDKLAEYVKRSCSSELMVGADKDAQENYQVFQSCMEKSETCLSKALNLLGNFIEQTDTEQKQASNQREELTSVNESTSLEGCDEDETLARSADAQLPAASTRGWSVDEQLLVMHSVIKSMQKEMELMKLISSDVKIGTSSETLTSYQHIWALQPYMSEAMLHEIQSHCLLKI